MIPTELQTLNRVRRMVGVLTDLLGSGSSLVDISKHSYKMREKGLDMVYFGWSVEGVCLSPRPTFRQFSYLKFFSGEVGGFPGVKKYDLLIYKDSVDFIMRQNVSGRLEECNIALDLSEDADFGTQNFNLKTKFNMEHNTSTNHENGNDANRLLCAVYIVLDCEAPPKDVIWSVNSTMEKAIESEKQLNEMRVGGALTKIIEERVD